MFGPDGMKINEPSHEILSFFFSIYDRICCRIGSAQLEPLLLSNIKVNSRDESLDQNLDL